MPAGQQYNKHLNYDAAWVKTPAIYDSGIDEWLMLQGNLLKTDGGIWIFQKGENNGNARVALTGSIETVNAAPVVGVKTVTATAAEVFAGASAKANRRKLLLKNEDATLRFRVGPSSVTQQNGFPVEPGAVVEFQFDPATAVAIYAISEGVSLNVAVMEI